MCNTLTDASFIVIGNDIMSGTGALVCGGWLARGTWQGNAQVRAIAIVHGTRVLSGLTRRVKHHKVRDRFEVVVNLRPVSSCRLVCPLDVTGVPVAPVDEVLILRYAEWIDHLLGDDRLPLSRLQVVAVYCGSV